MGRGACQLGRTAGVEVGEEESGGSISGGRERTWQKGRFVATGAMRELRQGFWAFHAMWEVQSGDLLYADVSGRSLQRAQGRMSNHKYSFREWFGEIEKSSANPLLMPPASMFLKQLLRPCIGRILFGHCKLLLTRILSRPTILRLRECNCQDISLQPLSPGSSILNTKTSFPGGSGSHTACIPSVS